MLSLAVSGSSLPCHTPHTKSSTLAEPGHAFISSLRTDFCIMGSFSPISAMTSDLSVLSGCPQVGQQGTSHMVQVSGAFTLAGLAKIPIKFEPVLARLNFLSEVSV